MHEYLREFEYDNDRHLLVWKDISVSIDLIGGWSLFQDPVNCTIIQSKHTTCEWVG